eukprot:653407-Alexandrium_andersonii.AAC.1
MSASLVGSEMCIRDSRCYAGLQSLRFTRRVRPLSGARAAPVGVLCGPVSLWQQQRREPRRG